MAKTGICRSLIGGLAVILTGVISAASGVLAAAGPVRVEAPQSIAVAITIDSENLIELYQSVPGLKIVDSRLREDFNEGHIETASNLPIGQTNCKTLSRLAGDRDKAIVFYCNGNAAEVSIDAIEIASACGYKRLFWFRGGFAEWEDKDYPFVIE